MRLRESGTSAMQKAKIGPTEEKKTKTKTQTPPGLWQDVTRGETLLTFLGRTRVRIENYRSILIYSETGIRIQGKRYQVTVTGKNLCIRWYDRDEMEITGRFESVTFE